MSGDIVGGDYIDGDKVGGDKLTGDKIVMGEEVRVIKKQTNAEHVVITNRESAQEMVVELDRAIAILLPFVTDGWKSGVRVDVIDEIATAYRKLSASRGKIMIDLVWEKGE